MSSLFEGTYWKAAWMAALMVGPLDGHNVGRSSNMYSDSSWNPAVKTW